MKRLLRIFIRLIRKCVGKLTPPPLRILLEFYIRMMYGYRQYAKLIKKHNAENIYLQYYKGTGDAYLSAAYLKYLENISQPACAKHIKDVFVVNGIAAYHTAELFKTDGIITIIFNETQSRSLIWLTRFLGNERLRLNILHYVSNFPMYTNFLIFLAGLNGIGFMDLYRATVFKNERFNLPTPEWNDDKKWALDYFRKHSFPLGKTVLIAPSASSIADGPDKKFWEQLAAALYKNGYYVCTNISRHKTRPIPHTESVFVPYSRLCSFLSTGGFFIGYRSGLCDLAASIKCKKIIIYPSDSWPVIDGLGIGSTKDVFSLKKMGFAQDVVEIEYQKDRQVKIIADIVRVIKQS